MYVNTYMGRLGDPTGVNVARVEVTWYDEERDEVGTGFYHVHATGEEPEAKGEDGTIYNVFENLVHEAMDAKVEAGRFDSWEIEDISSV